MSVIMLTRRLLPLGRPVGGGAIRSFGQRRTVAGFSRSNPEQVKLNQVTVQLNPSSTLSKSELKEQAIKLISGNLRVPSTHDAAVILASKGLAPWLDDQQFISRLLGATAASRTGCRLTVLTAAVDEVPRYDKNGAFASGEGISILPTKSGSLLPGLWSSVPGEGNSFTAPTKPFIEFHASPIGQGPRPEPSLQVTVPLANTVFETGRPHALAASEWTATGDAAPSSGQVWAMGQRVEKTTQTVILPPTSEEGSLLSTSLIPLTKPRKILSGLGNILRQVDVDSVETPASTELEKIIPTLLKKRLQHLNEAKQQEETEQGSGPVGVWALIIPKEVAAAVSIADRYIAPIPLGYYKGLGHYKLSEEWDLAQVTSPYIGRLLSWGCQLRKILSGGGGWGAKKGLLSLDPETSLETQDHEDLESFIRSFKGEDSSNGSGIVTPGSYVQFFTEGIYPRAYGQKAFYPNGSAYALGTLFERKPEEDKNKNKKGSEQINDPKRGWKADPGLFGALSSEGIYISSDDLGSGKFRTKIDAPSSCVVVAPSFPIALKSSDGDIDVEDVDQLRNVGEVADQSGVGEERK